MKKIICIIGGIILIITAIGIRDALPLDINKALEVIKKAFSPGGSASTTQSEEETIQKEKFSTTSEGFIITPPIPSTLAPETEEETDIGEKME